MEKMVIELKGLTCSHCGGKIENDVQKLNGVAKANLNLMKQELAVEFKEDKKEYWKM